MSTWYWKRMVAPTVALGIITGCGLLGAGTASAGMNGQHIAVQGSQEYAQICGWNQQNSYGCTPVFRTPGTDPVADPNNWWWVSVDAKHPVIINGWGKNMVPWGTSPERCYPPKKSAVDTTLCHAKWPNH
jgi:hypothetical protein